MQIGYMLAQADKDKLEKRIKATNLGDLDRLGLLYHYTQGLVEWSCGSEVEMLELRIPVLDFAWSLLHILETLQVSGEAIFAFTESHETILFRHSDTVVITTSYSGWTCQCSFDDLRSSVLRFNQTLIDDLCRSIPGFEENSIVGEARKKIADYRQST